jgi:hypothetical protein
MEDFDTEVSKVGHRRFQRFLAGKLAQLVFWLGIGAVLAKVLKS